MIDPKSPLGFSGKVAAYFVSSQLTPLLALLGLLLGLFAVIVTPREEEPQIDVTMANVFIPFPGAKVADVENLITNPMEQILGEIEGVEHIYSVSRPSMAILTVQYKVGVPRTEALVRLYNAIYSNQDWRPANLGIPGILVKPKGIDDVPVVTLTLTTKDQARGAFDLKQIAHALESEFKRVSGSRNIATIGGPLQVAQVTLDQQKLSARGLSIMDLRQALLGSNTSKPAGAIIHENRYIPVDAGEFLTNIEELSELIVGMHQSKPIYLQDVATITYGPAENQNYVWHADKQGTSPAVTMTISKKPGENAVDLANKLIKQTQALKGSFIPEGVDVHFSRNYGATADEKASKLIHKLFFATLSVVILVFWALGRREAVVVGSAVLLTLAMTLFASWAWGFTINRVSLFALIFSIGILVDDAIVIVENIHRHLIKGTQNLLEIIPKAVDEVGGPTILATFTVIAALLPMAFVTGLMGPYMSPIPINASMGMMLSLIVALTFTPWLSRQLLKHTGTHTLSSSKTDTLLLQFFHRVMSPFIGENNKGNRYKLAGGILGLIILAISLVLFKVVILKMLPFDNKSEIELVIDMPEGTPLEKTNGLLKDLTNYLMNVPEVVDVQAYAGTAAPIGFNGLIRQYYLRQAPHQGELQINLLDKHLRKRSSHKIASAIREPLVTIANRHQAKLKVVEVPPGPPVLAPLLIEVYGPNYQGQIALANQLRQKFANTPGIVDIDDSIEANAPRYIIKVDRQKAALVGLSQQDISDTLATALAGEDVTYMQTGHAKHPIPIRIILPIETKDDVRSVLDMKLPNRSGKLIPLSEVVSVENGEWEKSIHHKDLLPVVYVQGDTAGKVDSPLYGMMAVMGKVSNDIKQYFTKQPDNTHHYAIKWDGEWQITYETFRDMGMAYSVGLILIYLLVVAQFRSYVVPLIIMAPIPLTVIGILPGHALLGAQFTATSMIGMIALAGIIVRNSILLVDFINHAQREGVAIESAIIQSAAVRAKPIILTGLAAMMGAAFILDDPIFNGLAVSLIFGIFVSTILTLIVIPLLYASYINRRRSQTK